MIFLFSSILLIFILGFLIFIHELGHFIFAKWGGANVTDFSIGIGPSVLKFTWLNTPVHVRLFPLGGYVSLIGEVEDEGPGSFVRLPIFKQALIILGGIIFNIIGATLLTGFYLGLLRWQVYMPVPLSPKYATVKVLSSHVVITQLTNDSALKNYKNVVKEYPYVIKVDNEKINTINDLKTILLHYHKGDTLNIALGTGDNVGNQKLKNISVKLNQDAKLGIMVYEDRVLYWNYSGYNMLARPFAFMYDFTKISFNFLKIAISDAIVNHNTQVLEYSVGGPISILPVLSQTLESGHPVVQIIGIVGLLSLNLAIINAVPFPGLDGWHLFLIAVRRVFPSSKFSQLLKYVTYAGLLILLIIAIIITIKDLNLVVGIYGK